MKGRIKGLLSILLVVLMIVQGSISVYAEDSKMARTNKIYTSLEISSQSNLFWDPVNSEEPQYPLVAKGTEFITSSGSGAVFKVFINGEEVKDGLENLTPFDWYDIEGYAGKFTLGEAPSGYQNEGVATVVSTPISRIEDWGINWFFDYSEIYINYNLKGYDLKYDPGIGNGTPVWEKGITQGTPITLYDGSGFSLGGYKLVGWNLRKDNESDDPKYELGKEMIPEQEIPDLEVNGGTAILFANWKPYEVEYNVNNGLEWEYINNGYMNSNNQLNVEDPTGKYLPSQADLSFGGWKKEANGSKADFQVNDVITPSDFSADEYKMILYAHWVPKSAEYTIEYNANQGNGSANSQTAELGKDVTLENGDNFTRGGYKFIGWSETQDGSSGIYQPGETVGALATTKDTVVTLYAQWKPYQVHYDANQGTGSVNSHTLDTNNEASLSDASSLSKAGYRFAGWKIDPNGSNADFQVGETIDLSLFQNNQDEIKLYAHWVLDISEYTIKYHPNSGEGTEFTQKAEVGKQVTLSNGAGFQRAGYQLVGWSTDPNGGSKTYTLGEVVNALTNTKGDTVNLYAQWKPNTYHIRYYANKSSVSTLAESKTMEDDVDVNSVTSSAIVTRNLTKSEEEHIAEHTAELGQEVTLLDESKVSHTGYTFTGWNTSKDGTGISYTAGAKVSNLATKAGETVRLYAQWTQSTQTPNPQPPTTEGEGSSNGTGSGSTQTPNPQPPTTGGGGNSSGTENGSTQTPSPQPPTTGETGSSNGTGNGSTQTPSPQPPTTGGGGNSSGTENGSTQTPSPQPPTTEGTGSGSAVRPNVPNDKEEEKKPSKPVNKEEEKEPSKPTDKEEEKVPTKPVDKIVPSIPNVPSKNQDNKDDSEIPKTGDDVPLYLYFLGMILSLGCIGILRKER